MQRDARKKTPSASRSARTAGVRLRKAPATVRDRSFLIAVQARLARIAVSVSATRRQGPGVVAAAREHLAAVPLAHFAVVRDSVFRSRLDRATHQLQLALPRRSRNWGLSRKLLNIFLRDALYTRYLAEPYELWRIESYLEVPLDSITVGYLRAQAQRGRLPLWLGVKHLTAEASFRYQEFAAVLAAERHLARVHLDTFWWGQRETVMPKGSRVSP